MYYGKKAAVQLNLKRISLKKQHKEILAELKTGQKPSREAAQRLQSLDEAFRAAAIHSIGVSRTLTRKILLLNLGSLIDAHLASNRLCIVLNDVSKTLNEFDTKKTGT